MKTIKKGPERLKPGDKVIALYKGVYKAGIVEKFYPWVKYKITPDSESAYNSEETKVILNGRKRGLWIQGDEKVQINQTKED